MKVIPETRRLHYIWYLRFYFLYVYIHRSNQLFPFDIMVKRVNNVIRKGLSSYLKTNADMEWVGDLVVL
jgi:hypothetical protein